MTGELDNPLFARIFDRCFGRDRGRGESELRQELVAGLDGTVVEVGAGNGINFEHFPPSVSRLIAIEPEKYLRGQASAAAGRMGGRISVDVRPGLADATGLEDSSVDAIVVSGVLCSVPSQAGALAEFRRVLRPGGELRFYEHVRSNRRGFARWQRLAGPVWSQAMAGLPNRPQNARRDRVGRVPPHALQALRLPGRRAHLPRGAANPRRRGQ